MDRAQPPITIIINRLIEITMEKVSLLKAPHRTHQRPASPVIAQDRPKAAALVKAMCTPMAVAETSLSRTAAKARPSGARNRLR